MIYSFHYVSELRKKCLFDIAVLVLVVGVSVDVANFNNIKVMGPGKTLAVVLKVCAPKLPVPLTNKCQHYCNTDVHLMMWIIGPTPAFASPYHELSPTCSNTTPCFQ